MFSAPRALMNPPDGVPTPSRLSRAGSSSFEGTPLVSAVLGGISLCLGWLLTITATRLFGEYEDGDLEAASRRARELKPFVRDLRRFVLNQSRFIIEWPEAEAKVKNYRRQLQVIMKGNIQTVEA